MDEGIHEKVTNHRENYQFVTEVTPFTVPPL